MRLHARGYDETHTWVAASHVEHCRCMQTHGCRYGPNKSLKIHRQKTTCAAETSQYKTKLAQVDIFEEASARWWPSQPFKICRHKTPVAGPKHPFKPHRHKIPFTAETSQYKTQLAQVNIFEEAIARWYKQCRCVHTWHIYAGNFCLGSGGNATSWKWCWERRSQHEKEATKAQAKVDKKPFWGYVHEKAP